MTTYLMKHLEDDEVPFICGLCCKRFLTEKAAEGHVYEKHPADRDAWLVIGTRRTLLLKAGHADVLSRDESIRHYASRQRVPGQGKVAEASPLPMSKKPKTTTPWT